MAATLQLDQLVEANGGPSTTAPPVASAPNPKFSPSALPVGNLEPSAIERLLAIRGWQRTLDLPE